MLKTTTRTTTKQLFIVINYMYVYNIYVCTNQGGEVDAAEVEGRVGAAGLVAHELIGVHDDGALDGGYIRDVM